MTAQIRTLMDGKEIPVWERAQELFRATYDTPEKKALRENRERLQTLKERVAEVKVESRQRLQYNPDTRKWEFK